MQHTFHMGYWFPIGIRRSSLRGRASNALSRQYLACFLLFTALLRHFSLFFGIYTWLFFHFRDDKFHSVIYVLAHSGMARRCWYCARIYTAANATATYRDDSLHAMLALPDAMHTTMALYSAPILLSSMLQGGFLYYWLYIGCRSIYFDIEMTW